MGMSAPASEGFAAVAATYRMATCLHVAVLPEALDMRGLPIHHFGNDAVVGRGAGGGGGGNIVTRGSRISSH